MNETYLERLTKLSKLLPNWDSYGGFSIRPEAIEAARKFLCLHPEFQDAFIGPCGNGSINLEFTSDDVDVILSFDGEYVELFVENLRAT